MDRRRCWQVWRGVVRDKWTLKEGGAMRACLIFEPPRPMAQVHSMCENLKNRKADRWKKYWMPLGEVHRGRNGRKLVDSLPAHACEANIAALYGTTGPRTWSIAGLTVINEHQEKKKAGMSVQTFRQLVKENPDAGISVKQVCFVACLV